MSTRLVRPAGLIGAATMTSRVLGVARGTVILAGAARPLRIEEFGDVLRKIASRMGVS